MQIEWIDGIDPANGKRVLIQVKEIALLYEVDSFDTKTGLIMSGINERFYLKGTLESIEKDLGLVKVTENNGPKA